MRKIFSSLIILHSLISYSQNDSSIVKFNQIRFSLSAGLDYLMNKSIDHYVSSSADSLKYDKINPMNVGLFYCATFGYGYKGNALDIVYEHSDVMAVISNSNADIYDATKRYEEFFHYNRITLGILYSRQLLIKNVGIFEGSIGLLKHHIRFRNSYASDPLDFGPGDYKIAESCGLGVRLSASLLVALPNSNFSFGFGINSNYARIPNMIVNLDYFSIGGFGKIIYNIKW
jgi:hypothetical protein